MLTEEQKKKVSKWISEGEGLSAVQARIREEFGVSMTYMDVRLLVIELGVQVVDKPEPKPTANKSTNAAVDGVTPAANEDGREGYTPEGFEGGTSVSVTVDRVVRAGALASGEVTFSDGVRGSWLFDRMGRLSLTKVSQEGYQPSQADLEAFQMELQSKLGGGR